MNGGDFIIFIAQRNAGFDISGQVDFNQIIVAVIGNFRHHAGTLRQVARHGAINYLLAREGATIGPSVELDGLSAGINIVAIGITNPKFGEQVGAATVDAVKQTLARRRPVGFESITLGGESAEIFGYKISNIDMTKTT